MYKCDISWLFLHWRASLKWMGMEMGWPFLCHRSLIRHTWFSLAIFVSFSKWAVHSVIFFRICLFLFSFGRGPDDNNITSVSAFASPLMKRADFYLFIECDTFILVDNFLVTSNRPTVNVTERDRERENTGEEKNVFRKIQQQ